MATPRKTPDPAVLEAIATVDASIGRTANRIQISQATLERHRATYADLIALRQLLDRMK